MLQTGAQRHRRDARRTGHPWFGLGLAVVVALVGCEDHPEPRQDAGPRDAGMVEPDGGGRSDGGDPRDGGEGDGGGSDGGMVEPRTYDVVVVGAGAGGVSAALQAARMGMHVALLEETDWVGGQMTAAGVSFGDWYLQPPAGSGLYAEFVGRVRAYYADSTRFPPSGKPIGTCYFGTNNQCWEPHVGREILEAMLTEASVDLELRTRVIGVGSSGGVVREVTTARGVRFLSQVLIDATEYGDVIPLTGARYRVGRSSSDDIDPTACIQDITYVAVMRRYSAGVPASLRVTSPPPGYGTLGEEFATIVSATGDNTASWGFTYPVSWAVHNAYRGMPDSQNPLAYDADSFELISRTGANWANDYPGHYLERIGGSLERHWRGTLTVEYLENRSMRRRMDCAAKLVSLSFVHYAQQVLGQSDWSLADDEGYDTPYNTEDNDCPEIPAELKPLERLLPVIPYVRESRRIEAMHMLTTADLERGPRVFDPAIRNFASSIAVGDYGTDLHNCHEDGDLDFGETWADNYTRGSGGFQVPMESLIPENVDGFLAAEKNIGASRLAAGAIRLQPITMATGQAAGALAAVAVDQEIQPREVRPLDVQVELLAADSALARFSFTDVPPSDPRWRAVQLASVYDIMLPEDRSHFDPGGVFRRVDAAVSLSKLFGLVVSSPPATPTFADVDTTDEAYAYVEAFYLAGLSSGCASSPRRFCPTEAASRAEMAVFLVKGMGLDPTTASPTPRFTDVPASHPLFAYVQLAASSGVMQGCSGTAFCPDTSMTRGEAAVSVAEVLLRVGPP